jgi:hypothetical protein
MTIYINKNADNLCAFTLNESVTIPDAKYIIQLESKALNTSKLMWLNEDLSLNTQRYNEYLISEVLPEDEDLEDQKINLVEGGYSYFVWQTISNNLDLSQADKIIESGMVHVIGDPQQTNVSNITPSTKHIFKP